MKVMETLPSTLNEVVTQSNLTDLTKAQSIAANYAPLMVEVNAQMEIIKGLKKGNPEDVPTAKRASLDLGKICSRVKDRKKTDKDSILLEGRFIDALHNTVEGAARISQGEANEIVRHQEMLEAKRLLELQESRQKEALKFLGDELMIPENLCKMDSEVYKNYLFGIEASYNARIEAEKKAEEERLAKEKEEEESRIKMIADNKRLLEEAEAKEKSDKIEADKRAKVETERIESEARREAISNAKLKKEQDAKQKLEDELKAKEEEEAERLAIIEKNRILQETARAEMEQAELKKGDADKVQDLKADLEALKTKYSFNSAKYKKTYTDVNILIDKVINHINS